MELILPSSFTWPCEQLSGFKPCSLNVQVICLAADVELELSVFLSGKGTQLVNGIVKEMQLRKWQDPDELEGQN